MLARHARRSAGAARRLLVNGTIDRRDISGGAGGDPAPAGFGIVFDIDGVLVRGGTPIPGARNVLAYLAKLQKHEDPSKRVGEVIGRSVRKEPLSASSALWLVGHRCPTSS